MKRRTSELTKTLRNRWLMSHGGRVGTSSTNSFMRCPELCRTSEDCTLVTSAILLFLGLQTIGKAAGPVSVVFHASTDHATVVSYLLDVFANGSNPNTASPIASSNLGKPGVDANGDITVDRATFFNALAPGTYLVTVSAIGPGGSSRSTAVTFVVTSGPVSVPNVVGMTQAAATSAITGAGLTLGTVTPASSATVTAGLVISEKPAAGTSVAAGSAVHLVVSSGPATPPGTPTALNPTNGSTGVSTTPTLTWSATGATGYDVRFGASNPPPTVAVNQSNASYVPGTLTAGTTYFWQIVARNANGSTSGPTWTFTTGSGSSASYALIAHRVDSLGPNGGTGAALDTTGADLIVVLEAFSNNNGAGTLTDSKGNTWSQLTKQGSGGIGATVLWYARNAIVGPGHRFTITGNGTLLCHRRCRVQWQRPDLSL